VYRRGSCICKTRRREAKEQQAKEQHAPLRDANGIDGTLRARLLACIRPGQAPSMQDLDDWLPAKTPGPVPVHAKQRPRPGSRETRFICVSRGLGSVGARVPVSNDDVNL
jgi:hypothetical protein